MKDFDITIVGLGPGGRRFLTQEAYEVLRQAPEVYLRTVHHPIVAELPATLPVYSFDHLYQEKQSFVEIYEVISEKVIQLAGRPDGVIYAVPGHPLVAEESVRRILVRARELDYKVRIVSAVSFLEPLFALLELDPLAKGLQVLDATALAAYADWWNADGGRNNHRPRHAAAQTWARRPADPTVPLIIAQLHDKVVAVAVKLVLQELYPSDHPVVIARWAGIEGKEETRQVPLYELDRQPDIDHLTSLYVPPVEISADLASLAGLRYIVARLRAPGGCPWDRKQSHRTLKPYVIEEAYEVADAIDVGDSNKLCEELGDLVLQVVLHSQLATETGDFLLEHVFREISSKLIRRHPHVFAAKPVADASEVMRNWEQIKREERGENGTSIDNLPKNMPALAYAQAIQRRAARLGFDWQDLSSVIDKLAEEAREVLTATSSEQREEEIGDLLFTLVNISRWLDIDAEEALRQANKKFVERFHRVERLCQERGLDLTGLGPDMLDKLWEESKLQDN